MKWLHWRMRSCLPPPLPGPGELDGPVHAASRPEPSPATVRVPVVRRNSRLETPAAALLRRSSASLRMMLTPCSSAKPCQHGMDKASHLQSIAARAIYTPTWGGASRAKCGGSEPRLPPGPGLTRMRGTVSHPLRTGPARPGRERTGWIARCPHAPWAGGSSDARAGAARPGRRRALHRAHHPGGARRPDRLRPAARHPARRAGRPRPPRAAPAGRLRGQEPADRAGPGGQGAARRDRRARRGRGPPGRPARARRPPGRPARRPGGGGGGAVNEHLLSAGDLDAADITRILDTAAHLAKVTDRAIKKVPTLRGRTVCNLFFEDSTRTRISFELAAKRLSAD